MEAPRTKVLFVDDEQLVLDGLRRKHSRSFAISVARGAAAALDLVREEGPFAVVVSDHNMPGMDGVSLLARLREIAPQTVRILLTGQADAGLAKIAAERGAIFRFVAKPCDSDALGRILRAAVEEHGVMAGTAKDRSPQGIGGHSR